MELIYEIVFEILFELIFDGSLEIGTSKKVPMPVRILAAIVFLIFAGGILTLLFLAALAVMQNSIVLGWIFILFDMFLAGCIIFSIWKKMKSSGHDNK